MSEGRPNPDELLRRLEEDERRAARGKLTIFFGDTTLNVQHVESLKDVVTRITGVAIRETVPDSMLEAAEQIRLVDLPPDELLERLRDGKVYVPQQAQRAIESFFRQGNLIALREIALRRTAERVDAQMRQYKRAQGIEATWAASERILVGARTRRG